MSCRHQNNSIKSRKMNMMVFKLIAFALALSVSTVLSARCSTSHDCADGNSDTFDICLANSGHCINVYNSEAVGNDSLREETSRNPIVTTKDAIISEANANPLSLSDRRKIISMTSSFAGEFNPHRFIHLNLFKFDPVRALDDLTNRLETEELSNVEFHEEVRKVFQGMNDRHTLYIRPPPFGRSGAILGFQIKQFYKSSGFNLSFDPSPGYVVTDVQRDGPFNYPDSSFVVGVEILEWNGRSINEAVRLAGIETYGSNSGAQILAGSQQLVARGFIIDPIPAEESVNVTFRNLEGEVRTISLPWIYLKDPQVAETSEESSGASVPTQHKYNVRMEHQYIQNDGLGYLPGHVRSVEANRIAVPVHANFTSFIFAEIVQTANGRVGRMLVIEFPVLTSDIVSEYRRLLSLMPQNGLILDLRANKGGSPEVAGALLELVSNVQLPPLPTSIRATEFMSKFIFANESDLADDEEARETFDFLYKPYRPALSTALSVGERFTGPVELPNLAPTRQERVYNGPFIVVVDAATYSSGDVFAAFVKDTGATELVGTDDATGAGGATMVKYESLLRFIAPKLFEPLPAGVEFSTSFQRFFRTGNKSGSIVENFGIQPNVRYYLSKRDVLENDCDLFESLSKRLLRLGDVEGTSEPEMSPGFEI